MRILLIVQKCNYPDPQPHRDIIGQAMPYLAGALHKAGHTVFGFNISHQYIHGPVPLILDISLRNTIEKCEPELICLGGLSADYKYISDALRFIRIIAPHTPVVCGGGIITYDANYVFNKIKPDFAIIGYGERAVVALANALDGDGDVSAISNLIYWKDGEAIFNPVDYMVELDELPFPDYSPFDIERFFKYQNQADNYLYTHTRQNPRVLPISMGRSCPYKCTFCCHMSGPKPAMRSIDNSIAEVIELYEKYRFNILFIYDELFAVRKDRVLEFCEKIKKAQKEYKMDFDWTCDLRVRTITNEIVLEMKEAGCIFIGFGLESASPPVLQSMKKKVFVKSITKAIELTEAAGIGVQGNFIFGDIAENPATIKETVDFFFKYCKNHMVNMASLVPFPGSEIFDYSLKKGIIKSKDDYYNKVAGVGYYDVNMTVMPDDVFSKNVKKALALTDPDIMLYDPVSAKVVKCKRKGGWEWSDLDHPYEIRRKRWSVSSVCPHCEKVMEFIYPIRQEPPEHPLVAICPHCHKRSVIDVAPFMRDELDAEVAIEVPSVNKSIIWIGVYNGYDIVNYNDVFCAVLKELEEIDLFKLNEEAIADLIKKKRCFTSHSLGELKCGILMKFKGPWKYVFRIGRPMYRLSKTIRATFS